MKKTSLLVLSLVTMPAFGQSILSALNQHQVKLPSSSSTTTSGANSSGPVVKPSGQTTTSSSAQCTENDQSSVPLAFISSLIQEPNGELNIIHDPRSGTLKISSPNLIGNCSSMLEWNLNRPEIENKKSYAVEVKVKSDGNCALDGCKYKVAIVKDGQFEKYEEMVFKPTLKGFEECLQKSGVVVGGKVISGAIYPSPIRENFSGLDYSGQILLKSQGPSSKLIGAKYDKFIYIDGCDHYETIHPAVKNLLTLEDSETQRLNAEAEKLKQCKVDEYHKVADFIEKYEGYANQLAEVRNRLILDAAKKLAEALTTGKYTDEDFKVVQDFERYIVNPKVEKAQALYDESLDLEGEEKQNKQAELKLVLNEIKALNQKPYFLSGHVDKLIDAGKFDEAEQINGLKLVLQHNQNLGSKSNNVVITPAVAGQRVAAYRAAFSASLPALKERFNYKTGQDSGKASEYAELASNMRKKIQTDSVNVRKDIELEYEKIVQPNGYCYKYFRNTQNCIKASLEFIQERQNWLTHTNKVDAELAEKYDAKAKEYNDLENTGRRYLATQNGEEAPADVTPQALTATNPTAPTPRTQEGVYNFDYQGGQPNQQNPQGYPQPQQAQFTPQQYQYPTNPYQGQGPFQQPSYLTGQQQYNPWLGQQNYQNLSMMNPQQGWGGYNFSWGGGAAMGQQQYGSPYQQPYQQQGQQGYWGQPYQSYNMHSMYSR